MSYTGSIISSIQQQLLKESPADHARWACKPSFANHHPHHPDPDPLHEPHRICLIDNLDILF